MGSYSLSHLLSDISRDVGELRFVGQVLSIVLCFLLAWYVARTVQKRFASVEKTTGVIQMGVESFSRVLWPVLALLFLYFTRFFLGKIQHTSLLTLCIPIVASFALIRFGFYVLRRAFVRDGSVGSALLIFEKLFAAVVWFGVVLYLTGLWDELFHSLEEIVLPIGKGKISLLAVLQALMSVGLTLVLALWISAMLEARLMLITKMHSSLKVVLSRFGRAVFVLLAVLISLSLVGIDLTILSVFGGALGVGLGLGLQRIASSYVSGFIILMDRSLAIGDMITVDKFSGLVTQINTRYTVLKGLDGVESIIPNEMLVSNPVQNQSLTDRAVILTTDFTVSFKTDVPALLSQLIQVVAQVPRVSNTIEPSSYLVNFGADGFIVRVGFWIDDPENGKANIVSDVNLAILCLLKEGGIELPYPQRDVTIRQS